MCGGEADEFQEAHVVDEAFTSTIEAAKHLNQHTMIVKQMFILRTTATDITTTIAYVSTTTYPHYHYCYYHQYYHH